MEIALLVVVVGIVWFVLSRARVTAVVRVVEQHRVNDRDRLAHLVVAEMRRWERQDPANVGVPQCVERGTRWVLERSVGMAPALANMVAKSGYRQILREKLQRSLGMLNFSEFEDHMAREARRLDKVSGVKRGVDKWWDDVDYEFESLIEKAMEGDALDADFALKFYGQAEKKKAAKPKRLASAVASAADTASTSAPESPNGDASPSQTAACAACSTENQANAKFCKRCGASLAGIAQPRACQSCNAQTDADAEFCNACGAATAGT